MAYRGRPGRARRRAQVGSRLQELLASDGSPLLTDERVREQLLRQVDDILDEAISRVGVQGGDGADPAVSDDRLELSARIGEVRALSGMHPSQSLYAAGMLFEAALPAVADLARAAGRGEPEIAASIALNKAITLRITVAAEFYIGHLLERIHDSNIDERRRLSRELHDVVAPSIVLAHQNLQLHAAYGAESEQAGEKLQAAAKAITEAMTAVRLLAAQTRESLSRNGLEYAISHVLARSPADVDTEFDVTGDTEKLPAPYREEIFLVVQEALRNAFTHAHANQVSVTLHVDPHQVSAAVHDNGQGFDPLGANDLGDGLGLTSMRERAAILGGQILLDSRPDHGTTVTVNVPLPPHANQTLTHAGRSRD